MLWGFVEIKYNQKDLERKQENMLLPHDEEEITKKKEQSFRWKGFRWKRFYKEMSKKEPMVTPSKNYLIKNQSSVI